MAMTLRLSDEEVSALRARAALENRSMQDVARGAISAYISDRSTRLALAINAVSTDDVELLDRLSK
jgi:plasmid stability protein